MSHHLDGLFWFAVAVLATRVLLEIHWACRRLVGLIVAAANSAARLLPKRFETTAVGEADPDRLPAPRTNYLDTMSDEELDRLLGPQAKSISRNTQARRKPRSVPPLSG